MSSPKPQGSSSPPSSEESSVVQVMDSLEPLVTASFSGVRSAQVVDSFEPLVTASSVPSSSSSVQVIDSFEPLVATTSVQVIDSFEPLVTASPVPSSVQEVVDSVEPLPSTSGLSFTESTSVSGSSGRRIHPYTEEVRTMWNWKKIFSKLATRQDCISFAEEAGLIAARKTCAYHRTQMPLRPDAGQVGSFRCRKSHCRTREVSRATGTWFEHVRLALPLVFQLMYAFSVGLSYFDTKKELSEEDNPHTLSEKTISEWFSYCREAIVVYELEHQEEDGKIGGPNKIVQIDQSKFGRKKNYRGRKIEGHWVIGMIEDGSDDLRLEVCPDNERSAEILVPLIEKHVQEGSIIHTDYWRAYMTLPEHGYIHKRVNHSDPVNKFVAPDGTHTQRIQSQWRGLKKQFRQEHNKKDFTDWLCEFSWRRKNRVYHRDPFKELRKAIAYSYPVPE